jgi:hypothetical protein
MFGLFVWICHQYNSFFRFGFSIDLEIQFTSLKKDTVEQMKSRELFFVRIAINGAYL